MKKEFLPFFEDCCKRCRFYKNCRRQRFLQNIKGLIDSIMYEKIKVTVGRDDFDGLNHIYDVSIILGIIKALTYQGLELPVPKDNIKISISERRNLL